MSACPRCGRPLPDETCIDHQPGCGGDCQCPTVCPRCCRTCTLTVGSMFTGIGGLDLGLERAGMRVVWQAEIDPYCCRVLARHWPHVPNLGDVTTIDWAEVPRVDLICGGYPCQPFSVAGRQLGEADPRHLWPHMLDAIRVLRPRWALMENVPGHLALGFGRVLGDLAEIGYDTEWDCIPAAAVGAPHRRDRVYVVAWPQQRRHVADPGGGRRPDNGLRAGGHEPRPGRPHVADTSRVNGSDQPESDWPRLSVGTVVGPSGRTARRDSAEGTLVDRRGTGVVATDVGDTDRTSANAQPTPGRSWRTARQSGWWDVEPDVGRVAHGVPARVDRLRALGNAVVPQVAEHIGRLIQEAS